MKKYLFFAKTIFVIFTSLALSGSAWADYFQFQQGIPIPNHAASFRYECRVETSNNGIVTAFWHEQLGNSLLIQSAQSLDSAESWCDTVIVAGNGYPEPLNFDFDAAMVNNLAVVIFPDIEYEPLHCRLSYDNGATWQPEVYQVDDGTPGPKGYVRIAAHDHIMAAIWLDGRAGGLSSIWSSFSTDSGITWSSPDIRVDDELNVSFRYHLELLAVSGGGFIATWADARVDEDVDVWASVFTSGADNWSDNVQVNSEFDGYQQLPAIAQDAEGNLHIAYYNSSGLGENQIYAARSMDGGFTWDDSGQRVDDDGIKSCDAPGIACTANGNIVVTWADDRYSAGNYLIFTAISSDNGSTWTHPNIGIFNELPPGTAHRFPDISCINDYDILVNGFYHPTANTDSLFSVKGVWPNPPCLNTGDVNGDSTITPDDALQTFRIYLGMIPDPSWTENCAADCNGSGTVTPNDALCILQNFVSGGCQCEDLIASQ